MAQFLLNVKCLRYFTWLMSLRCDTLLNIALKYVLDDIQSQDNGNCGTYENHKMFLLLFLFCYIFITIWHQNLTDPIVSTHLWNIIPLSTIVSCSCLFFSNSAGDILLNYSLIIFVINYFSQAIFSSWPGSINRKLALRRLVSALQHHREGAHNSIFTTTRSFLAQRTQEIRRTLHHGCP